MHFNLTKERSVSVVKWDKTANRCDKSISRICFTNDLLQHGNNNNNNIDNNKAKL